MWALDGQAPHFEWAAKPANKVAAICSEAKPADESEAERSSWFLRGGAHGTEFSAGYGHQLPCNCPVTAL